MTIVQLVYSRIVSAYSLSQNTIESSRTIQNLLFNAPAERADIEIVLLYQHTITNRAERQYEHIQKVL